MKRDLYKAYIALGIVSFFWGTTFIASRIGAQHMPGLFVSGIRQFVSGSILVGFFLIRGYHLPGRAILKKISIQSIFLLCIANGLLTWSVEYISGGLAAVIAALVPLFIALFTAWLSKCSKISRLMLIGLLIGFTGVFTIFYDYMSQMHSKTFLLGVVLAVISTLSWSFGTVYTSRQKPPIDILFNVGLQMLIAGIVVLTVCIITGKYVSPAQIDQPSWLALGYLIVFGSLLAYSAYVFVIGKLPPTQVSMYAYINPVVAVLLGWLLLSEKMNANMIVGTIITLVGVYLVNREFKKQKHESN
ncbi:MAG: drug/metabolite-transporting permease [Bacteroidetes bacterium]|jgi:drug/metabolite transporter (DMT)-like permease|nr:MAG: drug/metabolite-transporting permease [Bacteroidota bacterium]